MGFGIWEYFYLGASLSPLVNMCGRSHVSEPQSTTAAPPLSLAQALDHWWLGGPKL